MPKRVTHLPIKVPDPPSFVHKNKSVRLSLNKNQDWKYLFFSPRIKKVNCLNRHDQKIILDESKLMFLPSMIFHRFEMINGTKSTLEKSVKHHCFDYLGELEVAFSLPDVLNFV